MGQNLSEIRATATPIHLASLLHQGERGATHVCIRGDQVDEGPVNRAAWLYFGPVNINDYNCRRTRRAGAVISKFVKEIMEFYEDNRGVGIG